MSFFYFFFMVTRNVALIKVITALWFPHSIKKADASHLLLLSFTLPFSLPLRTVAYIISHFFFMYSRFSCFNLLFSSKNFHSLPAFSYIHTTFLQKKLASLPPLIILVDTFLFCWGVMELINP